MMLAGRCALSPVCWERVFIYQIDIDLHCSRLAAPGLTDRGHEAVYQIPMS